jgi:putative transposase
MSSFKDWPHSPIHRLSTDGIYMVTGATLAKARLFEAPNRLELLQRELLTLAKQYKVQLEAWAVFGNHYHFVGRSNDPTSQLAKLIRHLHANSARKLNQPDGTAGRKVWFNFWDTKLTHERSYLARLNYVHQNAVKHGLVWQASEYAWCSASWFERSASAAEVKTIYSFKIDKLNIDDDY